MNAAPQTQKPRDSENNSRLVLAFLAVVVGAISGLVVSLFRAALQQADRWRDTLIAWAHGSPLFGFVLVVGTVALAAAIGAWLVRRFAPYASGSGIPHVELVVHGGLPPPPFRLLPVKFVGGLLAIGGGLALGREGPSVQMGATIGSCLAKAFRRSTVDQRALLAAGAGAGLATAFNAPIAGALFVLEELYREFNTRIAVVALGASASAIAVAHLFVGDAPEFRVPSFNGSSVGVAAVYIGLGIIAGLAGVAYNRSILGALAISDRFSCWPVEARAALIGTGVGTLAWFAPRLVGGGEALTQHAISGGEILTLLPLVFLTRFALGSASYAAGTPGGLFAPMLVLGAQLGVLFAAACQGAFPELGGPTEAFAVVGMAAFFAAVVRTPLTGIILICEMTACYTLLLPMLIACFAAMVVPILFSNPPIYDSLHNRMMRSIDE